MMKYIRTFAGTILLIELALTVVLVIGLVVPLPGRIEFKIVQSGSMEPVMPVGSVVAVLPQAEYAVGDIITFGDDTKTRIPTTHRIVAIKREGGRVQYITKGDVNEEADNAPVPHSAVIGAVALTVPRLGYILHFARTERGFFFMAVIPAALIMLDEVLNIAAVLWARRRDVSVRAARAPHPYPHERAPVTGHQVVVARARPPREFVAPARRSSIDGVRLVMRLPRYA